MNRKQVSYLLLISSLAFAPYLFFDGLFGYDSYAFVNSICNYDYWHNPSTVTTPLAGWVFSVLPCNIIFLKFFLFVLMLSSVLILSKTGELIDENNGWMAGAFLFLAPLFPQVFAKLENDTLALPFVFLGIYYLVKAQYHVDPPRWLRPGQPEDIPSQMVGHLKQISGKGKIRAFSILLFILAAFFWNAVAFVLLGMAFSYWWVFILALVPLAYYGKILFAQLAISGEIAENAEILGFIGVFLLLLGFLAPILPPVTLFLGVISFLNGKYVILVIPFLALGILNLLLKIKVDKDLWIKAFFIFSFAMAFAGGLLLVTKPLPSQADWNAVDSALELSKQTGKPIKNDFQLGYLLDYRGYHSTNYGFLEEGWENETKNTIVATHLVLDCPITSEFEPYYVYNC